MSIVCIDLSHWQAGFDFQAYAAGGGLAVILKATEGDTVTDESYADFRAAALDAGLGVASYHFLHPGDMAQQADFFLSICNPGQGERVVADHEDSGVNVDDLCAFLQAIQSLRPDLQLTVYSGFLIKDQLGSSHNVWLASNTSLWIAEYEVNAPAWPTATWPYYSLWQYSDQGKVAGYDGPVDANTFNGSDDGLVAWIGPAQPAPAPLPEAAMTLTITSSVPVTLAIVTDDNVTLV